MRMLPWMAWFGLVIAWNGPCALGEPWSEKLGFGPSSRVLLVDLQELGVAWEFNHGAIKALEAGTATTASLVTTGPVLPTIATWARQHPEYDWGVSIALTNPHRALRWKLIASPNSVPELLDGEGYPWSTVMQLVINATPEAVDHELHAQLATARALGVPVTHLSGYYGTVFSRPDLARVFLHASRQHWLPTAVVDVTPEQIERFTRKGFPIEEEMLQLIRDYPLPKIDDLREIPDADTLAEKRSLCLQMLKDLPPSLTLLVVRPAVASPGIAEFVQDHEQRVLNTELLCDPEFKSALDEAGILVTNWRDIMERFETGGVRNSSRD